MLTGQGGTQCAQMDLHAQGAVKHKPNLKLWCVLGVKEEKE